MTRKSSAKPIDVCDNNVWLKIFETSAPPVQPSCLSFLKPGSHMPPTYLGHWAEFNFAGKPAVNAWDRLCVGDKCSDCSHMPQLSQAVSAAMSQVIWLYQLSWQCKLATVVNSVDKTKLSCNTLTDAAPQFLEVKKLNPCPPPPLPPPPPVGRAYENQA